MDTRFVTVTFDYDGITHPESDEELDGMEALAQWREEFAYAALCADEAVFVGWREIQGFLVHKRMQVRFIVDAALTDTQVCDAIQTALYDEGGLSGGYTMGAVSPHYVEVPVTVVETRLTWAANEADARAAHGL